MTKFHVVSYCGTVQTALLAWIIAAADPDNTTIFKTVHDYRAWLKSSKESVKDVHLILVHTHPTSVLPGWVEQFKHITQYTLYTAERMAERASQGAEKDPLRTGPYSRVFGPYHSQITDAWMGYNRGVSMPRYIELAATEPETLSDEDKAVYGNVSMVLTHLIRDDLKFDNGQITGRDFKHQLGRLFLLNEVELHVYHFAGKFAREKVVERNEALARTAELKNMNGLSIPTVNAKPTSGLAREMIKKHGLGCAFFIREGKVIGYVYMRPAFYEMLKPEMLKQQLPNCDLPLPWKPDDEYVYVMFEFPYDGNEQRFPLK